MAIRPLTRKAMDIIGETGYCTSSETYATEMYRLKKLGLYGNGNIVGLGCRDGRSCGWSNDEYIAYEQHLIDEGHDSEGHSQNTINKLRKAMSK